MIRTGRADEGGDGHRSPPATYAVDFRAEAGVRLRGRHFGDWEACGTVGDSVVYTQGSGRLRWPSAIFLCLVSTALLVSACGQKPAAPPKLVSRLVGQVFPTASAKDLSKHVQRIPADYAGAPMLILVTPSKGSQPDADRWIAYLRGRSSVRFREVPVIPSAIARAMQGFINGQMRGGLPKDMWTRVVPLYKDGGRVKDFFGSYSDQVAWAMVLDSTGVIRWFHAAAYGDDTAAEAIKARTSSSGRRASASPLVALRGRLRAWADEPPAIPY